MVNIFVGAERKRYYLHHDLLCDRSDYFAALFSGKLKDAQQNELSLPEDDIGSFDIFVRWLYGASLRINCDAEVPVYLNLYVLANKLCLEYLQNETMDLILRFHRTTPYRVNVEGLHPIFRNFSDRGVYKYFISLAAWSTASNNDDIDSGYLNLIRDGGDFAVDFTKVLSIYYRVMKRDPVLIANSDPRAWSNCCWHEHNSTPVCEDLSE